MPQSHDVTLPRDSEPAFPDGCVVCGHPRPNATLVLAERPTHMLTLFLPFLGGKKHTVEIPACGACSAEIKGSKRRRDLMEWGIVIAAVILVVFFFNDIGRRLRFLALLGAVVIGVLPTAVYSAFRPLAADITVKSDSIDYEFARLEYARAFAELNGGRVE